MIMQILDHIINALIVLFVPAFITFVVKYFKTNLQLRKSNKIIMKREIMKIYYSASMRGYIYDYELQNCEEMFVNYKELGGNSYIQDDVMPYLRKIKMKCSRINIK